MWLFGAKARVAREYAPLSEGDWSVSTPGQQGLDPMLLARLYHEAAELGTLYGLLVVKNGFRRNCVSATEKPSASSFQNRFQNIEANMLFFAHASAGTRATCNPKRRLMNMFDDINTGIESLTIPDATLLQTHLAPLGLQMLRDILARDWEGLDQSGAVALRIGRAGFEARATQIAERRRQILGIFRDYDLSRLEEVDPELFAQGSAGSGDLDAVTRQILTQIAKARKRHDEVLESNLDANLALSYAAHGIKARSHAGFNLAIVEEDPAPPATAVARLKAATAAFSSEGRQAQLAAYSAILSAAPGPALRESLAAAATKLESSLPAFYASVAPYVRTYLAAVEEGVVGRTDQIGRALTKANDAWREGICTYIAFQQLRLLLLRFRRAGEHRVLIDRAAEFAFDGVVPNGVDIDIADVAKQDDGAFVELRGIVRELDQEVLCDDTLVSKLRLGSVNGAADVLCAVRFAHLGRMGIGVGSFLRINCHKQDQVKVLDKAPGVMIDHLSHVKLAKTSWRYALLRLSEPYFPRWRHKLNIAWSPIPHTAPTGESIVAGANEFIYSPFLR